jgi:hypothetical protein
MEEAAATELARPMMYRSREALDEIEAELDDLRGLLLRAFRALDYGQPSNRHPANVSKHEQAVALRDELLGLYRDGRLGR